MAIKAQMDAAGAGIYLMHANLRLGKEEIKEASEKYKACIAVADEKTPKIVKYTAKVATVVFAGLVMARFLPIIVESVCMSLTGVAIVGTGLGIIDPITESGRADTLKSGRKLIDAWSPKEGETSTKTIKISDRNSLTLIFLRQKAKK